MTPKPHSLADFGRFCAHGRRGVRERPRVARPALGGSEPAGPRARDERGAPAPATARRARAETGRRLPRASARRDRRRAGPRRAAVDHAVDPGLDEDEARRRRRPSSGRGARRRRAAGSRRGAAPRGAPEQRQPDPCERAIHAPSSSAAQSCSRPPNGTTTGVRPEASAPRRRGARCRTARRDDGGDVVAERSRRETSVSTRSTAWSDASRAMSSPGDGDVKTATRAASPRPTSSSRCAARRSLARPSAPGRRATRHARRSARVPAGRRRAARPARPDRPSRCSSCGTTRIASPARRAGSSSRCRGEVERGVLREDRPLEALEQRARLETELLEEHGPPVAVVLERLGLPPGAVERDHQLRAEPVAERVLARNGLELADDLGARPVARSASKRSSSAVRRSSSSRAISVWAHAS